MGGGVREKGRRERKEEREGERERGSERKGRVTEIR